MIPANVIKALECCALKQDCTECPQSIARYGDCENQIKVDALALIHRQRAEIERLQTENKLLLEKSLSTKFPHCVLSGNGAILTKSLAEYDKMIGDISAEAIKEFADRLKKELGFGHHIQPYQIDNLVKEMTG